MERILNILRDIRPEFEFGTEPDFFGKGMLDSFDLTTLIAELEREFGITIEGGDIVPENLKNLDRIAATVRKYGGTVA